MKNAYVSGINHGRDPWALIEALPADAIGEIHLAGFAEDRDAAGDRLLIDHHGSACQRRQRTQTVHIGGVGLRTDAPPLCGDS